MIHSIIITFDFIGSVISAGAYVPQISHLVKGRCTAGLSKRAFGWWLVSAVLMLVNALYIGSPVFVFLTSVQTLATAIIFGFTTVYDGKVCEYHAHHGLEPVS